MQSIRDQIIGIAASRRTEILNAANGGADDDLSEEERPNREAVSPGCLLKPLDEVELYGGMTAIYLCPGRGVGWMYTMSIEGDMITVGQYEPQYVTNRLPADPEETPMPIFAEPPP